MGYMCAVPSSRAEMEHGRRGLRRLSSFFFFSSRRRHTRLQGDWSSDVCSSDLGSLCLWSAETPGMRRLFVDTFYLIALAHPRDQWRPRVLAFSRALRDYHLYTVDEVLAEFLAACSSSGTRIRQRAGQTVRTALQDRQW